MPICRLFRRTLWIALFALAPTVASAHVRWFIAADHPVDWTRLWSVPVFLALGVTLALYGALRLLRRIAGSNHFPNPPFLANLEPSATTLLAVQTGISLVWFASQRYLFVPNMPLPGTLLGWALIFGQLVVAFTFITAIFDRYGALLLALVYLAGFLIVPPIHLFEAAYFLGIALAMFALGRSVAPPGPGKRALTWLAVREREVITVLRLLTGFALVVAAMTEKLLAPEAGLAFLQEYPYFNFPQNLLGITWFTDERFVYAAGIAEASMGLLLMSGVLTRVVILAMLVPFNLAVAFVPPEDLLGHLPIFGIMYVLLLFGSGFDPANRDRANSYTVTGDPPEAGPPPAPERKPAGAVAATSGSHR